MGSYINRLQTKSYCRTKIMDIICVLIKIKDYPTSTLHETAPPLTPQNKPRTSPI